VNIIIKNVIFYHPIRLRQLIFIFNNSNTNEQTSEDMADRADHQKKLQ